MHLRARKEKQVKTVPRETFCVQAIGVGRRVMKGTKNMVGKEGTKPRHLWKPKVSRRMMVSNFICLRDMNDGIKVAKG